jgi:hypothetical protein
MKIKKFYEVQTESNIATGEEIATLIVNLNRGMHLREVKALNEKIYFVFEEAESSVTKSDLLSIRKFDANDTGCCDPKCGYFNAGKNEAPFSKDETPCHCSLYNEELVGFVSKTRCGACQNDK